MAFKPTVRKARFQVNDPFAANRMVLFGNALVNSMKNRIFAGRDANDQQTPPLSKGYERRKALQYPPAERNMRRTGRSLRAPQVLRATYGRSTVGMIDPVAIRRFNLQRFRFWAVSPVNRKEMLAEGDQILAGKVVEVKRIA